MGRIPDAPPGISRRPFWLMKVLLKTIESGGFITPKLYMSRAMWFQPDAKYNAVKEKVTGLEMLLEAMIQLLSVDRNDAAGVKLVSLISSISIGYI